MVKIEFVGFDPDKVKEKDIKRYIKMMDKEVGLSEEEKSKIKKKILKNKK